MMSAAGQPALSSEAIIFIAGAEWLKKRL